MKEGKNFEMAVKVYLRRLASLFLCCLLVFCSIPVKAHASDPVTAASLAITGGQFAGAGLTGEAALSLAGPVGAVVGVTLGALGVNAYVSQAAQEAGKTRTRFVLDKLVLWGAQAGYTQEQLYTRIAQGVSVAVDGTLQLGRDAAKIIEQFGNWLFTQEGEVVPNVGTGETVVSPSIGEYKLTYFSPPTTGKAITGYSYNNPSITYDTVYVTSFNSRLETALIACTNGYVLISLSGPGNFGIYFYNAGSVVSSGDYSVTTQENNIWYYRGGAQVITSGIETFPGTQSQFISYLRSNTLTVDSTTDSHDEVFTGTPESWAENKDVLNPSAEDTPVVVNPDLVNPIIDSLTDGQQATMTIIDYLDALQRTWDHALDDVQTSIGTITDQLTGIQEQIAVPQDAVKNPTVTNPSVTPDTTPILNPSDVNPGTAITGLSFDLTNIFPFCIPFDIYAALDLLDAEPVAPSYHFHLEWPYNIVIDFTLDLSPFDQVAAVARTMETLIFIIGLAVMTRSMFIRG